MVDKTEALLQKLQQRIAAAPRAKPVLRVVESASGVPRGMDAITRDSHVRMIGHLRRRYGLQLLVDQATFGKCSVDALEDAELVQLHRDLERARECIADGISLEDAGLLRNQVMSEGEEHHA